MDDELIEAISESMPKFNSYLLKDFTKEQINSSADFVGVCYAEAVKLFNGELIYNGYRILSPEERAAFELAKGGASISTSDLSLVSYSFTYDGMEYEKRLYMPYLKNTGLININDTKYAIQRGITECVFSRMTEGVTVRVMRAPLHFKRNRIFKLISAVTEMYTNEFVAIAFIWQDRKARKAKKALDTSIVHYLLAKFGFPQVLRRFRIEPEDMLFVKEIGTDTNEFDYFLAKKKSNVMDLYLKVKKTLLADPTYRKLAANILYTLTHFDRHTIADLYDPSGSIFRVMLGKIIQKDLPDLQCQNQMDTHLSSVDFYLDPISKRRINSFGVAVDDIYDLFQYIFVELDRIIVNSTYQDLYNKRIDILTNILIKPFVEEIFKKFYRAEQINRKLIPKDINGMLNIKTMSIKDAGKSRNMIVSPDMYNDNLLASAMIFKIRQTGQVAGPNHMAPESRFHPSLAVVESMVAFSGKYPGVTGSINPYVPISREGGIIKPDYAKDIDAIAEYLPHR